MVNRQVIAALVGVAALIVLGLLWTRAPQEASLYPQRLTSIPADYWEKDAGPIVKRGSGRVVFVRFLQPMEFVPFHFRKQGLESPLTIEQWADTLQAPVVINAGQFDERLNYLGWLKADGNWLGPTLKPAWKALLVSGPLVGPPFAGIIDLETTKPEIENSYKHVVQSMMLFDESGDVRVRDTDLAACRAFVGQDHAGHIVFGVTEGAMTLADLARWLHQSDLQLRRAMNLDGGIEAQIVIRTPEFKLVLYGQHSTGTTNFVGAAGQIQYPIPAVVAVRPASSL